MKSHVFMPRDVPRPFISECQALGAEVTLIDGLITDCGKAAAEGVKRFGRFDISTLKEPYRIEGKKTMGYEVAEQMGWTLPDVIIYPGGGTGLVGMWKACVEPIRFNLDGSIGEVEMTSQGAGPPLDARKPIDAERACLLFGKRTDSKVRRRQRRAIRDPPRRPIKRRLANRHRPGPISRRRSRLVAAVPRRGRRPLRHRLAAIRVRGSPDSVLRTH